MKSDFRFTEAQQKNLLDCWKKPCDKKIAAIFISEAECIIAGWKFETTRFPPTPIRSRISSAEDIQTKALDLLNALDNLPKDVAGLIGVIWLREKYGNAYFEQHAESCHKDQENETVIRNLLGSAFSQLSPERAAKWKPIPLETSKLPPDFPLATKEAIAYLSPLCRAAGITASLHRESKQWRNKEAAQNLLLALALSYKHNFGKPPSAANARTGQPESASPFRKFITAIESIIRLKLGAPLIREAVNTVRTYRETPRNY